MKSCMNGMELDNERIIKMTEKRRSSSESEIIKKVCSDNR